MRITFHGVLPLALSVAVAGCTNHYAENDRDDRNEEDGVAVTIDQVPAAVKSALMQASSGGKIDEIDRVTDAGKTMYEADILIDGKKWEVVVMADGTLSKRALDRETDGEDGDEDDKDEKDDD